MGGQFFEIGLLQGGIFGLNGHTTRCAAVGAEIGAAVAAVDFARRPATVAGVMILERGLAVLEVLVAAE